MKKQHHDVYTFNRFIRKVGVGFLCLLMVFGLTVMPVNAEDIEHDLGSAVTITGGQLTLGGTPVVNNQVISKDESLKLTCDFNFDDGQGNSLSKGEPNHYIIPQPAGIKWITGDGTAISVPVVANTEDGPLEFATLHVDPTAGPSGQAYLVFGGAFWGSYSSLTNVSLEMACGLELGSDPLAKDISIALYGSSSVNILIEENQPKDHSLTKSGSYANDEFSWTITYEVGDKTAAPYTLIDTFDASKMIYKTGSYSVTVNGGPPITTGVLDAGTPGTIKYTLPATPPLSLGDTVVVTYKTVLADAQLLPGTTAKQNTVVNNTAELYDGALATGITATSGNVTASGKDKTWLDKTGQVMDGVNGRSILWTIKIKTFGRDLSNLTLYDRLSDTHTLDQASIIINGSPLSAGSNANLITGSALDSVSGDPTFAIELLPTSGSYAAEYTITYETKISPTEFNESLTDDEDDLKCDNNAWLDFNWNEYGPGTTPVTFLPFPEFEVGVGVHTGLLRKSFVGYDPATHIITWQVEVNPHAAWLVGGTITDDLTGRDMTYVPGSLDLKSSPHLTKIEFCDTNDTYMEILVGKPGVSGEVGQAKPVFTFKTYVTNELHYAHNLPAAGVSYPNTAAFEGQVRRGNTSTGVIEPAKAKSTANAKVTSNVLEKAGTAYDYNNGEVTWKITLNKNKMLMQGVVLVDTLPAYLSYVDLSVTSNSTSNPATAITSDGGKTLTITVANDVTGTVEITYRTKVNPDLNPNFKTNDKVVLSNSVMLKRSNASDHVPVVGSRTIDNKLAKKGGKLNAGEGYIEYTVNLNPNGIDMTGIVISDVLPEGLLPDLDNFSLVEANVSAGGVFSVKPGGDVYTLDTVGLTINADDNSFSFPMPAGNKHFILTYRCDIIDYTIVNPTNEISLSGSGVGGLAAADSVAVSIAAASGAGFGADKRKASIELTLEDADNPGQPLKGVMFGLNTEIGGNDVTVQKKETDDDGKLMFSALSLNRDYQIEPLASPATHSDPIIDPVSGLTMSMSTFSFISALTMPLMASSAPLSTGIVSTPPPLSSGPSGASIVTTPTTTTVTKAPKTSDDSPVQLWIVMILVAAAGCAFVLRRLYKLGPGRKQ